MKALLFMTSLRTNADTIRRESIGPPMNPGENRNQNFFSPEEQEAQIRLFLRD